MTVKNYDKYLKISKLFNEDFGGGNKLYKESVFTQAVKVKLANEENFSCSYITIVNLQREDLWQELSKKYVNEAVDVIKQYLTKAAETYKETNNEKITFKVDSKTVKFEIEFLNYSIIRTNRNAYFKVHCSGTIS